jgi:hypothetical protein
MELRHCRVRFPGDPGESRPDYLRHSAVRRQTDGGGRDSSQRPDPAPDLFRHGRRRTMDSRCIRYPF